AALPHLRVRLVKFTDSCHVSCQRHQMRLALRLEWTGKVLQDAAKMCKRRRLPRRANGDRLPRQLWYGGDFDHVVERLACRVGAELLSARQLRAIGGEVDR